MVIARIVLALTVFVAGCGSSAERRSTPALNGRRGPGHQRGSSRRAWPVPRRVRTSLCS